MRVARLHGREDLRLHDEDRPRPGPGEVLVRVRAVERCGWDIDWFAEGGIGEAHVRRPFVLGHEFGGTTEDGRRVAIDPAIPCEACPSCLAGHANLCPSVRFAGDGAYDGGLGEWVAWPERCLVPLPDPLTEADGAMLEPLGVAIHALDLAHLRLGARVGVFGCGPIGLLLVQLGRLAGARVFATDLARRPHRLQAARALGAEVFAAEDGREGGSIREAAGSGGLDVALETAGEQAAVDPPVQAQRPGARLRLVGLPPHARTSLLPHSPPPQGLPLL